MATNNSLKNAAILTAALMTHNAVAESGSLHTRLDCGHTGQTNNPDVYCTVVDDRDTNITTLPFVWFRTPGNILNASNGSPMLSFSADGMPEENTYMASVVDNNGKPALCFSAINYNNYLLRASNFVCADDVATFLNPGNTALDNLNVVFLSNPDNKNTTHAVVAWKQDAGKDTELWGFRVQDTMFTGNPDEVEYIPFKQGAEYITTVSGFRKLSSNGRVASAQVMNDKLNPLYPDTYRELVFGVNGGRVFDYSEPQGKSGQTPVSRCSAMPCSSIQPK